mmetsp:Transcript_26248/g.46924  ORF Transcript_26248/g.46924 Transcript_26248/m.46924 type:complete len:299 (+) Transcript_26248:5407-6303(+)
MSELLQELKAKLQASKATCLNTLREFRFKSDLDVTSEAPVQHVHEKFNEIKGYFDLQTYRDKLKQNLEVADSQLRVKLLTLIESLYILEQEIDLAQAALDSAGDTSKSSVKELVLLGLRLSGTASAPADWAYDTALPITYRPPTPQEHEIRASSLFTKQLQERVPKPTIKTTPFPDVIRIVMQCSRQDCLIRYTLDNSLPTELTGRQYEGPFEIETGAEFVIKAVAFKRGMRESEVVVYLHRDESFKMPAPVEAQIERPKHVVSPSRVLDLGLSPPSSIYSGSDDEEFSSPYFSFPSK